jgi:hypothetical protein
MAIEETGRLTPKELERVHTWLNSSRNILDVGAGEFMHVKTTKPLLDGNHWKVFLGWFLLEVEGTIILTFGTDFYREHGAFTRTEIHTWR